MAFILESTLDGSATVTKEFPLTNSEAAAVGEAMKFASGKLTKAGAQDAPAAIAIQAVDAGTGNTADTIPIRRDQVFKAPYASSSTNVPGVGGKYRLNSTATGVDADNADGKFEVLSVDTTNAVCRGRFLIG
jgi:hypothetical protein